MLIATQRANSEAAADAQQRQIGAEMMVTGLGMMQGR